MTSAAIETLDLQTIPGVGPSIAGDLTELGIRRVRDLEGRDPNELYERLSERRGVRMDPCVLYVFRCAVHYAETHAAEGGRPVGELAGPERELLKWWNWKGRVHANERPGAAA